MRNALAVLLLICATVGSAQTTPPPTIINWTWSNPNKTFPACSTTLTTYCGLYQALVNITNSATPVIVDQAIPLFAEAATEPAPVRTSGSGTYTYQLVYAYKDIQGVTQGLQSNIATVVVSAPVAPPVMPTNFNGTVVTTTVVTQTTTGKKTN